MNATYTGQTRGLGQLGGLGGGRTHGVEGIDWAVVGLAAEVANVRFRS